MFYNFKWIKQDEAESDGDIGGTGGNSLSIDLEAASKEIADSLFGDSNVETSSDEDSFGSEQESEKQKNIQTDADESGGDGTGDGTDKTEEGTEVPSATGQVEAPKTWKPEAAAEWSKVPPLVQQEILKREQDMFTGLETYKVAADFGKTVHSILNPYAEGIRSRGGDPIDHVHKILEADRILSTASDEEKVEHFMALARSYGVNFQADDVSFEDTTVKELRQTVASLQSRLDNQDKTAQNAHRLQIEKEVKAFESDPKNIYFNELGNDIARLISTGVATSLQEAYDKAVWTNPITRDKEIQRQQKEREEKSKAEAAKQVTKAKTLTSLNVKATRTGKSGTAPTRTIDDTLRAKLEEIKSRP